jgi:hypothetical protein
MDFWRGGVRKSEHRCGLSRGFLRTRTHSRQTFWLFWFRISLKLAVIARTPLVSITAVNSQERGSLDFLRFFRIPFLIKANTPIKFIPYSRTISLRQ